MLSTAAEKPTALSDTKKRTQSFLFRKIWLPKLVYALLPYFYLASGLVAFLATIYVSDWFWVVPLYLLFSAACVHLGVIVYRRRNRDEA